MAATIILESVAGDAPVEITRVSTGAVTVGRVPENDIVIDSEAVSRRHGCILESGSQWIFRDLGSSNGSWVNGQQVTAGQMRLLRPGDTLQLADFPMRIAGEAGTAFDSPDPISLITFFGETFHGEYSVSTRGFKVGGNAADIYIEGEPRESNQLSIHPLPQGLELRVFEAGVSVVVNGIAVRGPVSVADRDEIVVGLYRIFVNDTRSVQQGHLRGISGAAPMETRYVEAYHRPEVPEHLRSRYPEDEDWESESSRRRARAGRKFIFAGPEETEDETTGTVTVGIRDMPGQGFGLNVSQRLSALSYEEEVEVHSEGSERLYAIVGMVLLAVIAIVVLYLVL